jgi:hypothetical protein
MKSMKSLFWPLVLMIVLASLYRVIPGRPYGFAPQWALALFSGAIVKDKKWAFALPVLSMFISDLIYQGLFAAGLTPMQGFYQGMWINYLLFASVTVFGFFIKKVTVTNVFIMSLVAPTYFFLVSNFLTWAGIGEYVEYEKSWNGLITCYTIGLPFYKTSLIATVAFSAILFGAYVLITRKRGSLAKA